MNATDLLKALDLLHEAGAQPRLRYSSIQKWTVVALWRLRAPTHHQTLGSVKNAVRAYTARQTTLEAIA